MYSTIELLRTRSRKLIEWRSLINMNEGRLEQLALGE